jgi:multicomponent K+:H+ antiporter subunit F
MTSPLLSWALRFALGCLTLAMMFSTARIIIGPRAEDRVLAFDSFYTNAMLLVLTLGLVYSSSSYFEAALLIALFGFLSSTAMSKFLLRGEIIE